MKMWSQQTIDPPHQTISLSNEHGSAMAELKDNQLVFHYQPGTKQCTKIWDLPGLTPETIEKYKDCAMTLVLGFCHDKHARYVHLKTLLEGLPKNFEERKAALEWTTEEGHTWKTEYGILDQLVFLFDTNAKVTASVSDNDGKFIPEREVHTVEQGLQELIDGSIDVARSHMSFYRAIIDDVEEILAWNA